MTPARSATMPEKSRPRKAASVVPMTLRSTSSHLEPVRGLAAFATQLPATNPLPCPTDSAPLSRREGSR